MQTVNTTNSMGKTNTADKNLNAIIRNLVFDYQNLADESGITLKISSKNVKCVINTDKYCVEQAISNLINNAIQFTKKGQIDLSIIQNRAKTIFCIKDTGIGISQDYLNRLYTPFTQESEGVSRNYEGLGLGLALTKKHLDLVNAEIDVESKKNIGTTFTIIFPNKID